MPTHMGGLERFEIEQCAVKWQNWRRNCDESTVTVVMTSPRPSGVSFLDATRIGNWHSMVRSPPWAPSAVMTWQNCYLCGHFDVRRRKSIGSAPTSIEGDPSASKEDASAKRPFDGYLVMIVPLMLPKTSLPVGACALFYRFFASAAFAVRCHSSHSTLHPWLDLHSGIVERCSRFGQCIKNSCLLLSL